MGGAGGMDRKGFGITEIGDVAEQFQAINEFSTCFTSTFGAEAEHRARTFWQKFLGALMIRMTLQACIRHPTDFGMILQKLCYGLGVLDMALHAQGQCLKSLNE